MTRKHYTIIANTFERFLASVVSEAEQQILLDLAENLAGQFSEENDNFNQDRFMAAVKKGQN